MMETKKELLNRLNKLYTAVQKDAFSRSLFLSKNEDELTTKITKSKESFINNLLSLLDYYNVDSSFLQLLIIDMVITAKNNIDFSYTCGMDKNNSKHNRDRLQTIIKECKEAQRYSNQILIFDNLPLLPLSIQTGVNKMLEMLAINQDINLHLINLISDTDRKSLPRYDKKIKDRVEKYQKNLIEKLENSIK